MSELIGLILAIVIGGSLSIITGRNIQQDSNERLLAATTAQQQLEFNNAVSTYVKSYKAELERIVRNKESTTISVSVLKKVKLLPASFGDKNPFNQTWEAQILQPTAGNFQVLTFGAGGETMKDSQAAKVATIIGKVGGIIPQNDSSAYPLGSTMALGSFGGWQLPTTGYLNISGGRSASLLYFNDGQLMSNYLYRNAVPGQPQLNQMNTTLEMKKNNISNANTISTEMLKTTGEANIGGNLTASKLVTGANLMLTNIANEDTPCPTNGLEARSDTGAPLYCLSGTWQSPFGRGFTGWHLVPSHGCAWKDGFLLATSGHNTYMKGISSDVQRFEDSRRDKYGQGRNSTLMPVMKGECYTIQGAERVWFMSM